jgi:uncharacterized membrane protein HdeD (DUF308 family)
MSSSPQLPPDGPLHAELEQFRRNWGWFAVFGVALAVLGFVAIGAPFVAGTAVVIVLGIALMLGGVGQVIGAFRVRIGRGFFLYLLIGVLYFVLGMLIVDHPVGAEIGLTLLLAVSLLVGGILRIVIGLTERFPGRGWVLLNGVVSALLGTFIWRGWPSSGLVVIGIFVGIELIFNGVHWLMVGLAARSIPREPQS